MHAEHHEKAESMLLWLDRNPPTVQDCRRADSKDPGKCFRSLAPVCISVSSAVKFETLNIPPGCTFHGHSQRLARISISCSLQVSFQMPLSSCVFLSWPWLMDHRAWVIAAWAWPPRIDLSRHLKKHTLQMVLSTWAKISQNANEIHEMPSILEKDFKMQNVQMANEKSHWATPLGASCVLQMWKFLNDALFTLSEYVGYTWRRYNAHLLFEMNGYIEKQFK